MHNLVPLIAALILILLLFFVANAHAAHDHKQVSRLSHMDCTLIVRNGFLGVACKTRGIVGFYRELRPFNGLPQVRINIDTAP